jgi:hypothetical protein
VVRAKRQCARPWRHAAKKSVIGVKACKQQQVKVAARALKPKGVIMKTVCAALSRSKSRIVQVIERIAKINKKGVSDLIHIDPKCLRDRGCKATETSMFQSNNGVAFLRRDSPLCKKYEVKRLYKTGSGGALVGFQLVGFNQNVHFSRAIPQHVRTATLSKYGCKCILCGSTDKLEVDHKNGRYNCVTDKVDDFQILCKSCNDKKREKCKKCTATGTRFNVQQAISSHLYKQPYTQGGPKYNDKLGCKGCFLYDIEDFYKKNGEKTSKVTKPRKGKVSYMTK